MNELLLSKLINILTSELARVGDVKISNIYDVNLINNVQIKTNRLFIQMIDGEHNLIVANDARKLTDEEEYLNNDDRERYANNV